MLSLTRQERLLLIFLSTLFLLGLTLNYALKRHSSLGHFYEYPRIQTQGNLNININNATLEELTRLPGVGKQIASRIIQYRTIHGGFKEKEELKNIKGIGEKKFQKIEQYISINPKSK